MIAIGNDHAGTVLKSYIINFFDENKIDYIDCGCEQGERCDYPNKAAEVCSLINDKKAELGILICGTGIGMSISANKIKGIRAAAVSDYFSAKYTRLHNDANVLCMGARVVGDEYAVELVKVFLETGFEGGRHADRVGLISKLEGSC